MKTNRATKLNLFILIVCAIFALFSLVACNANEKPQDIEHQHTYSQTVVEPTCQERGYTIFKCECGHTYKGNYVDITDHKFVAGKCKYCAALKDFEIKYLNIKGQSNDNSSSYTVEDEFEIKDLSPFDGWIFDGWYDEFGNAMTKIEKGTCRAITLTAKWLPYVDLNEIAFEDKTFIYNGEGKSIFAENVPSYCNVVYINNIATNAGEYTATAKFYVGGEYAGQKTATLTIEKAEYIFEGLSFVSQTFEYNGKPRKLTVSGLPAHTTVSYENQTATDVGVYSASATVNYDDGNRCGQTVLYATLTINKSNYDMSGVSFKDATYIYDGQEKSIVATGLPDGVTVSYDTQPTSLVGEYIITASFNGDEKNYFEIPSKTATLKIKKATYDLKNVTYSAYPSDYYTGEAHTLVANGLPDGVTVSFNDEGKCINAGEYFLNATFTVTNENYNKIPSKQMTLTIKKATVDMSAVSFESKIVTYDGKEKSIVADNVPEFVSVKYSPATCTNAGRYKIVAQFTVDENNYNKIADKTASLIINKATYDMSEVVYGETEFVYDGESKSFDIDNLPDGVRAVYSFDEVNAGKYDVIVSFVGDSENYNSIPNQIISITIEKATIDMSGVSFEDGTFTYNGASHSLFATNIPSNVTVSYENNEQIYAGKYNVVAHFAVDTQNYNAVADMSATLTVEAAEYDVSDIIFEDATFPYDGETKHIFVTNIPADIKVTYTPDDCVEVGEYTIVAKFEVDENKYEPIADMSAKLTIIKATVDMSAVRFESKTFRYDGQGKNLEIKNLPTFVKCTFDTVNCVEIGTYTITASFEVDSSRYNEIAPMQATLEIVKGIYDTSGFAFSDDTFVYDGNAHYLEVVGVPDDVVVTYDNNGKTDAGEYTVVAHFAVDDTHFEDVADMSAKLTISKASIDMSEVSFANLTTTYDGTEKSVTVSNLPSGVSVSYQNNCAISAGTYNAVATFSLIDENNFNSIPDKTAVLTIQKRYITANFVGDADIIYDGKAHKNLSATFDNVVDGDNINYEISYSGDMIACGDYTASVSISSDNYILTGANVCTLTIYMAHYFDLVFENTDEYLYVVGNGNNILLSSLFKPLEDAEILSEDVVVSVSAITGNVTCKVTANTTEWSNGTLKFTNTGIVTVSISQQGRGELTLNLEVVSAKNATKYSDISGSVAFLNNIEMPENGTRSFSNATIYGNGFTFDVTKGNNSTASGIIALASSHLNNLRIIASVYPELSMSVNTTYFATAIQTTGTSSITNCYIANARFCVRAFSGNLTISDTILDGGRYGNLFITGGTVNANNLTTINMPRDGVCGIGILFDNAGTNDMRLNISGDFKQYNWLAKNADKQYFENTDMASFFKKIFESSYSDIQFSYNGDTYANACICSLKNELPTSAVSGLPSNYKIYNISMSGMNGFVMSNDKTKYALNSNSFDTPEYGCERVPSKPTYTYNGATLNASGNIPVTYNDGENYEFDLNILTAKKFGYNLAVMPTVNGVEYASGKIILNASSSYKFDIVFKVTDTYVFGADGMQLTAVEYAVVYTVEVNVIKNIQNPTVTFKDKDGNTYSATTVTVGNETYIVPDAETGYSQTVGGVKVNCIVVDGSRVLKYLENTVYHYFPYFAGITIKDYDEDGNVVTTINSSTTSLPSTIEVISKNGNTGSTTGSLSQLTATKYDNLLCIEGNGSGSTESNKTATTVYFKYKYTANNGKVFYYYVAYNMGEPKTVLF